MGASSNNKKLQMIWFDEQINNNENQIHFTKLKLIFNNNIKGYKLLDEGFEIFYKNEKSNKKKNEFKLIFVIVSGRLFGKYIKIIKDNINRIINIPFTYIFTSLNFKKVLLNELPDKEHILSYDTCIAVNNGFYNPGGVYDDFDLLLNDIKKKKNRIQSNINIVPRIKDKINYEGLLTFEYLESEEDLLAPALYKDIITNEEIKQEDIQNFHNFILSFNEGELNNLVKYLSFFKFIPFEILSKFWSRFYSIESDFYKVLNNTLMNSKLPFNYKTFIKMLYKGVEINSLKSYTEKYLYRGSVINKKEIEIIKKYRDNAKLSFVVVFSKAFLSFSEDKNEAKKFCGISDDTKIGCLYILENNNHNLHESNANIQDYSIFPNEKEILFFPGSSFIIKNISDLNENLIEITLNYNGKFREKYNLIYEDQEKINNLIFNNEMTKIISGKKLNFLKCGKYLKENCIGQDALEIIFKGKDLETDEIVSIKQIRKNHRESADYYYNQVNSLKIISEKIEYSCKYKESFETLNDFYIITGYYDDNLLNYFSKYFKRNNINMPQNLINKIFKQINLALKELLNNNIIHRDIEPNNILIKYLNEEKTNFNSFLSGYDLSENLNEDGLSNKLCGQIQFAAPEIAQGKYYSNKCDLYSIGVTIYFLYFGEFPYEVSLINNMISMKKSSKFDLNMNKENLEENSEIKDLLNKLLKLEPKERITWKEYFEHPFFKQYNY